MLKFTDSLAWGGYAGDLRETSGKEVGSWSKMLGNELVARGNADTLGLASEQGMVPLTSRATHPPSLSMASQSHPLLYRDPNPPELPASTKTPLWADIAGERNKGDWVPCPAFQCMTDFLRQRWTPKDAVVGFGCTGWEAAVSLSATWHPRVAGWAWSKHPLPQKKRRQ